MTEQRNSSASFESRVAYAIRGLIINEDSRAFDDCFEMCDGEYVVAAIFRKAREHRILQEALVSRWSVTALEDHPWCEVEADLAHIPTDNLPAIAAKARAKARAEFLSRYRSELTEAGEQTVIPGCERDDERTGAKQLSLF